MFYLKMLFLPLITSIALAFRIILSIKRPPYIAGMEKKKNTVSVYAWALGKGSGFYREFKYKKMKNGRFAFKYNVLDLFCIIFPLVAIAAVYYLIISSELVTFSKYLDIEIPFFIALSISLAELYAMANFSQISARIHFRKYFKNGK